jgi:nicotinate-nucleotide adenylyltransferase
VNAADRVRRIGLLGGTFDPPHLAHVALAQLALRHLFLDEVRWMPAGRPWQKMAGAGPVPSQAAHRVAMVSLAIQGEPRFVLDDREVHRQGPSYTVDTLKELRAEHPQARWFLIIGQDQLGRFDTWKDWRQLLQWVTLAVAARSGQPPTPPAAFSGVGASIEELPMPNMPVSSTELRRAVSRGEDISLLAGPAIAGYIAHHHLYQDATA